MEQLISNIEELVREHDFVIIPGFGGFVAEAQGSIERDDTFFPPKKVLVFNSSLTYNDGLLAHQYVKRSNISFEKANLLIAGAVNELNRQLINFSCAKFGALGMFSINNGRISFDMFDDGCFLPSSFGLDAVYFPEITYETEITQAASVQAPVIVPATQKTETPHTVSIDSDGGRRSYSRTFAVAAAIALFIILFPVSIQDGKFSNYAAMIPNIVLTPAVEETTAVAEQPVCTPYHIIIASFNTKGRVNKFMQEIPAALKDECGIIYSENRFRVAYKSFSTEETAEEYLQQFVETYPAYYDAWVLNYNP